MKTVLILIIGRISHHYWIIFFHHNLEEKKRIDLLSRKTMRYLHMFSFRTRKNVNKTHIFIEMRLDRSSEKSGCVISVFKRKEVKLEHGLTFFSLQKKIFERWRAKKRASRTSIINNFGCIVYIRNLSSNEVCILNKLCKRSRKPS